MGKDPFGSVLDLTIGDKQIRGKPITILRFNSRLDFEPVHILFVSSSENSDLSKILGQLDEAPIVTVGEMEGFLDSGGMIYLYLEGNRVRFSVNRDAAKMRDIEISAKLLKLAKVQ